MIIVEDENPSDICAICSSVQPAGTMKDVNDIDFEILCPRCESCRCSNCEHRKDSRGKSSCSYRGNIPDPKNKVCENWSRTLGSGGKVKNKGRFYG